MSKITDFLYMVTDKINGIDTKSHSEQKQKQFDKSYLKMCYVWAENSYARHRKVGCLVVKDNMIISDGYNGTPSGFSNVCEDYKNPYTLEWEESKSQSELREIIQKFPDIETRTKPEVLHAEANALTKLAKSANSSLGATLYVTCQPCFNCAKLIIQSGIARVVYSEDYHDKSGLELLEKAGIKVDKIEIIKEMV